MKNAYQQQQEISLNHILEALPRGGGESLKRFATQFYGKTPVSELRRMDAGGAVAIANSAYEFISKREPGKPKIRIFTPDKKTHGYESRFPVIELLNDDRPFLVDSLSSELSRQGFTIRETLHPILKVIRDKKGGLKEVAAASDDKDTVTTESFIHFQISSLPEGVTPAQLQADMEWVLEHVRVTVDDWRPIVQKVTDSVASLERARSHFDAGAITEAEDFLRWLLDRNFVFMGYAEYNFFDAHGREQLSVVPNSRLGILKLTDEIIPQGSDSLSPEVRHFLQVPQLVEITKSKRRSPVHRPVPMDYVGFKRFDESGKVIGEARFLGLFTSNVYYQSADEIPLVRRKIAHVMERADFDAASHDGKSLKTILEFLPRDELFQIAEDDLFETSMGILALEAKPGVRLFVRRDAFERFISAMVFVPRERFSTELRRQIQALIDRAFNSTSVSFNTLIGDAPLARLHVIARTTPGEIPTVDVAALEAKIARLAYLWSDLLFEELHKHHPEQKVERLQRLYAQAFPQAYINRYDSASAVHDIDKIEQAFEQQGLALELFHIKSDPDATLHLKIYNPQEENALSDILPLLENAGFRVIDEHPFQLSLADGRQAWVRDFKLQVIGAMQPLEAIKPLLEETLLSVWRRDMENDRFNALVLRAGISARQVVMLRAIAKYLKQIGFAYAQPSIEQALIAQPDITAHLVALFIARFDPSVKDREARQEQLREAIDTKLGEVSNVVEDRIIRRYVEIMQAILRTNYYQDGKPVLSFKFASGRVPELPKPHPYAEIFVYSPRVEGIHLRGGKVARGGLRWSDRHEDFRTEVLGLMKAQMVKNSVIVPVGSKGGFVVKQPPQTGGREAYMEEGIACYKAYLRGLLDLTDNIVSGKVVAPAQLVRHDEDDPYLVVAADKGTATFSDIANSVSAEYGFWLGDAFASGGSAGYDHKKMGITARGGWVSVTRHFAEMGTDIATTDFTCVGIGDLAGDVFGNGMLLSNHIKLLAAFNHMHIFIDPNPDTAKSFLERQRMFNLPRSTWKDYDASLISAGGGIYERSAKSITLTTQAQLALGISKATLTPDELIRAILMAPVDLLWNGGIGTYVKAEDETHEQVGDRANNAVRINGKELRCKIVGEGGNLGFTQKGRIEYARSGGRINTDAIDNSAGVDCSDHEVNIKITFSQDVASGKLPIPKRDKLLADMTDEVAALVLKDNILQTQAISITEQQGAKLLESQARLMHTLERQGLLDRAIEFLPNDKQLAELKLTHKGLTRPEIAVLLAYSKMVLFPALLESSLPDEPYFAADLKRYFPKAMQEGFASSIERHPLKREIIATVATNSLINRAGITFFFDIAEDLGVGARDIVAAYTLARDAFGLRGMWEDIEHTSGLNVATQAALYGSISEFLSRVTEWLLRNQTLPLDIDKVSREIVPGIAVIEKHKASMHSEATRAASAATLAQLKSQGVPDALAEKITSLDLLSSAFDIILVAARSKLPIEEAGKIYFEMGDRVHLGWLRRSASRITTGTHWERLAVQAMLGDLYDEQRRLTAAVISSCNSKKCDGSVDAWASTNSEDLTRFERFMDDLKADATPDIPKLMVALRHVRSLGGV